MPMRFMLPTPSAVYAGEPAAMGAGTLTANTAYLHAVDVLVPVTLTAIRCKFGSGGNGHYDVGIYDSTGANNTAGNLLAHAAATASSLTSGNGTRNPSLIGGNLSLSPGRYWLAFWTDNATDTVVKVGGGGNLDLIPAQAGTTTGPLPANASSLTGLGNIGIRVGLIGLISGGWS